MEPLVQRHWLSYVQVLSRNEIGLVADIINDRLGADWPTYGIQSHEASLLPALQAQLSLDPCSAHSVGFFRVHCASVTALTNESVGGFVTMSHLGWRWTQWISLIVSFSLLVLYVLACPETYSPVLLARRAEARGTSTATTKRKVDLKGLAHLYVLKPWIMIIQEPILALVTLYMGFIFGFQYLGFEAYPISFEQERGWNIGIGSLPFVSNAVGFILGAIIVIIHTRTRMRQKLILHGDAPEERLVPMMLGSILLPIGMFWFGCESSLCTLRHSLLTIRLLQGRRILQLLGCRR